ncbi:MAG: flagellar biosynthesis protein FliP [Actinomycetota bacterium]|jgi:flagellar biosynthetic protein FliP|nr:flagellar biosynthesis protein FliP [Actinomycetota bacterium]MDQ1573037.1 flagellar biosynthesis protein FliP [Actinomycetota bacterium]
MTAVSTGSRTIRRRRILLSSIGAGFLAILFTVIAPALSAAAAIPTPITTPTPTPVPTPTAPSINDIIQSSLNGPNGTPSDSVVVLIGITLLSVAPSLILMMSSFTKIFIVLAMTRNAMGLTTIPPNQILAGLALFLSIFIMWPVITDINSSAVQPYMSGAIDINHAITLAEAPLRTFMLAHTRQEDLALMTRAAGRPNPASPASVSLSTLIPAFMISELRSAFIIGFVIFVPFLVIDLVVSSALMAMGMMMLPPVMISLPFKILLFILVDGWGLLVTTLVGSYGST